MSISAREAGGGEPFGGVARTVGVTITRTATRTATTLGGIGGVLAAGVALGVAELASVATGPQTSPVVAVGQGVIRLTPEWAKEFAIRTFGQNDKVALLTGTFALLVVAAFVVGALAVRRPRIGLAGVAAFGLLGAVAALAQPGATALAVMPSLVGGAAGIVALAALVRHLRGPAPTGPAGGGPAEDAVVGPPAGPPLMRNRKGLDRRGFLLTSGAALGVAVVAGGTGRQLLGQRFDVSQARAALRLPAPASPAPPLPAGVDLTVPGLTPFTTANRDFYRVDTALVLPQVDPKSWQLRIHGMVDRPMTLTFDDLLARDLIERDITLTCVSNEVGGNLAGEARWLGAPLPALLDAVGVHAGADQIVTTSADGWTCGTPTSACRTTANAMLAVGMNGQPLPIAHGFPVRMIVPGLFGYVSGTKWIVDMELTTFRAFDPYWVRRGWKAQAPIKLMSRIDTPRGLAEVKSGRTVQVAGVAWAQTRGIERVEVRVDDGPWQAARLAPQANKETWRQWVWDWQPDSRGLRTLQVRATDGDGVVQTQTQMSPFPEGATGWHDVVVTVT
jgi:DMSO/TMAO reductase YedYZ molybdopterin-dependent catalytic subunit